MLTRRRFSTIALAPFIGGIAGWSGSAAAARASFATLEDAFARIETESGGRLGVAVLDTGNGTFAGHRAGERFPLCSTFKLLAAAAVLARADAGREQLARRIRIEPKAILSYAPVTREHVGADMSLSELCEAAVTVSDNTAANLIVASLGGPSRVTRYARSLGDTVTRLDRVEPNLNGATPGDPRDTTTPAAMARNLRALATGDALSPASRDLLTAWLIGCKTGAAKLRAGIPGTWRAGDKTGSGGHGTSNDVAVIWPEGHAPLIVAAYLTGTTAPDDRRDAAHAAIGRAVAAALTG